MRFFFPPQPFPKDFALLSVWLKTLLYIFHESFNYFVVDFVQFCFHRLLHLTVHRVWSNLWWCRWGPGHVSSSAASPELALHHNSLWRSCCLDLYHKRCSSVLHRLRNVPITKTILQRKACLWHVLYVELLEPLKSIRKMQSLSSDFKVKLKCLFDSAVECRIWFALVMPILSSAKLCHSLL